MTRIRCELEGQVLVLLGQFNPAIVQPSWLALQNLVRTAEAETATVEIISPHLSVFNVGNIRLVVQTDKFQLETVAVEDGPTLRDLAVGVFRILEHTPVTALGINREMHFRMDSIEEWHKIGDRLVPKEPWNLVMPTPGTKSIVVQNDRRPSSGSVPDEGVLTLRLEPSTRVSPGVYVNSNLHFAANRARSLEILESRWESAQGEARGAAETLIRASLNGVS